MQPYSPQAISSLIPQRDMLMLFRALPKETEKRITDNVKFEAQQVTSQELLNRDTRLAKIAGSKIILDAITFRVYYNSVTKCYTLIHP